MKTPFIFAALVTFPCMALSEDIRVYHRQGNDLFYFGDTLSSDAVAKILGGEKALREMGLPKYVVSYGKDKVLPIYGPDPSSLELLWQGDGVVTGEPDDLTFTEDEGTDTREDLVFGEDEGTDIKDDLTFSEQEGTDTRDGMVFGEDEGTDVRDDLIFTEEEGAAGESGPRAEQSDGMRIVEEHNGPVELFKQSDGPKVTPEDGQWRAVILEAVATGCPPGASEQARAQVLRSNTRTVTFSKPDWHPADLGGEGRSYTWHKVGQNGYFSIPYSTGAEAEGSGVSLSVSTAYMARSATQFDVWYRVHTTLAPALAAIAGSSESCEILVLAELTKQ